MPARFKMLEEDKFNHYEVHCTLADKAKCENGRLIDLTYIKDLDKHWLEVSLAFLDKMKGSKKPFYLYHATRGCHFDNYPSDEWAGKSRSRTVYGDCMVQMDYVLGQLVEKLQQIGDYNKLVYVLAVEKLLQLEVPRKATWMRMALGELVRIHSTWSPSVRPRSRSARSRCSGTASASVTSCSTSSRWSPGRACTRATSRSAAWPRTSRWASTTRPESSASGCRGGRRVRGDPQLEQDLAGADGRRRRVSAEDAIALGQAGPNLRASGVDWDLRKREPYLAYDQVDFDVPVYAGGDVFDRYKVRVDEMRESVRIIEQCIDRLEQMQGEPWIADDRKVVLPPREELHTSMESLIHHFKIVTEGFRVPEGEVYVGIESPRGESGCTIVSDGTAKPWRVKFRAPSFAALHATAACCQDVAVADLIAVVGSLDAVMGDVDR